MVARIGVVGVGYMGALHAEKLAELERRGEPVRLAGVVDIVDERARAIGARHGVPPHTRLDALLPRVDALVVAVPTVEHYAVVRAVLEAGIDVLVEKPIAATPAEAEALIALADRAGLILQVGHLEWFNTAMEVIGKHIHRPRFIEVHRMGPFPERATDVDVVRDLMIHDLDILQQLLGAEPERIEAVGVPVLTENVDIANARVTYPCGAVANLTASRVSPTAIRKLRFFQRDGYFSVDFLEQSAMVARRQPGRPDAGPSVEVERLEVPRGDALLAQLCSFAYALETRTRPHSNGAGQRAWAAGAGGRGVVHGDLETNGPGAVDGAWGLGALRTAIRVVAAIEASAAVAADR